MPRKDRLGTTVPTSAVAAMGLGVATPAHRGALLWLVTWHCHLPLVAAQVSTSGAEDAAALREAKAAADTSACHG